MVYNYLVKTEERINLVYYKFCNIRNDTALDSQ